MSNFLTTILKNMGCSYCQEFEYENNANDKFKSWKLSTKSVYFTSAGATALDLDSNLNSRKRKHNATSSQRKLWKKKSYKKAFGI
jgi:hypothetical protein